MDRRVFIKKSCGGFILLAGHHYWPTNSDKLIQFGLVTDLHYADRETGGTRYYNQSLQKLSEAIRIFNENSCDFIIELGDFKDQKDNPDKESTLNYLDTVENTFRKFNGPAYHVLGNHDMDSISKEEFLNHITNNGKPAEPYYSFIHQNIKFIVLDANHNENGEDYNSGNFDWTKAVIPPKQIEWLEKELAKDDYPAILFIHQLLDYFSDVWKDVCVLNASEVVPVLEASKKVLAVFQGHHHNGHYSYQNGIHYFTLKGAIEGSLPENNSFAVVSIDNNLNILIDGYYNCEDKEMKRY